MLKILPISICRKLQESVFHFSSFSAMVNETEKAHIIDSEFEDDYMNDFQEEENMNDDDNDKNVSQVDISKCYADFILNGE